MKICPLRIYRDIADSGSLSYGALGILTKYFFRENINDPIILEELYTQSIDTQDLIDEYYNELVDEGYIL